MLVLLCVAAIGGGGIWLYGQLESDFLPAQDEGAFVIDYFSRPGTSLTETDRMLRHVEEDPAIRAGSRKFFAAYRSADWLWRSPNPIPVTSWSNSVQIEHEVRHRSSRTCVTR